MDLRTPSSTQRQSRRFFAVLLTCLLVVLTGASPVLATPSRLAQLAIPTALTPDPDLSVDTSVVWGGERDVNEVLLGKAATVRVQATNLTAPALFNASYRLALPSGASVTASYKGAPLTAQTFPQGNGTTIYVWENVSDLFPGVAAGIDLSLTYGAGFAPGPQSIAPEVFANSDPNFVPDFSTTGEPIEGAASFTSYQSDPTTLTLVPFVITKHTAAPEHEVMRGVQQYKYVTTLTVDNNGLGASSAFDIVDYLPANLEFLGCGGVDHTATNTPEYPGSGPLSTGTTLAGGVCPAPSAVETVSIGAGGPVPAGVYTKLTWANATLTAAGRGSLAANGSFAISYLVGAPMRANTMTWDGPGGAPTPASGNQGANLDNNNGPVNPETGTEPSARNTADLTGTYGAGPTNAYTSRDAETVTLEDLAIQKGRNLGGIVPAQTTIWTIDIEASEYTTASTGVTVTDVVPDGLCPEGLNAGEPGTSGCPLGGGARSYTSAAYDATAGTFTLTWTGVLPPTAPPALSLTYTTKTQPNYRVKGGGSPVLANDGWTNSARIEGQLTDRLLAQRTVADVSSATQTASDITLTKKAANPILGECGPGGDGTGLTWVANPTGLSFGPGDLTCWLITVHSPNILDTSTISVTDVLPLGHQYVTSRLLGGAALAPVGATTGRTITWNTPGAIGGNQDAKIVLTSKITSPTAGAPMDLTDNLAKITYTSTDGKLFQLRDSAGTTWAEPRLVLNKSASPTSGNSNDIITFTVQVQNTGNAPAVNVEVWDRIPARLTCADIVIGAPGSCDAATGTVKRTIPSIAAAANASFTYTGRLPGDAAPGETFANTAGVRTYQAATNTTPALFTYYPARNIDPSLEPLANIEPANDSARVIVTVPSAIVAKTHTRAVTETGNSATQAAIGELVTYTATVTLPRDTTLPINATLTDALPAGLRLEGTPSVSAPPPSLLTLGTAPNDPLITTTSNTVAVTFRSPIVSPDDADPTHRQFLLSYPARVINVASSVAGTSLPNTVTLAYTPPMAIVPITKAATDRVPVVEPDIGVAISLTDASGDGRIGGGEVITATLTISNGQQGKSATVAHDSALVLNVPAGLTVGAIPNGGVWDPVARTVTWQIGDLAPNSNQAISVQLTAPATVPVGTTYTLRGSATTSSMAGANPDERIGTATPPPAGDRYVEAKSTTIGSVRTSTTKSVDKTQATIGELVTFTLTAATPAGSVAYDATIVDTLPPGMTYQSTTSATCDTPATIAAPWVSADRSTVVWFPNDVLATGNTAVPRSCTVIFTAMVADVEAAKAGQTLTNTSWFAANSNNRRVNQPTVTTTPTALLNTYSSRESAIDTVTVVEPNITLAKSNNDADGVLRTGDNVQYTIDVGNQTPAGDSVAASVAYDVVVTDTLPGSMSPNLASATLDGAPISGTWDAATGRVSWTIPSVAVGATRTLVYSATVNSAIRVQDSLTNTVQAAASSLSGSLPGERNPLAADGSVEPGAVNAGRYLVGAQNHLNAPTFGFTKTADRTSAAPGQEIEYTVKVIEPAHVVASDVRLTDTLPADVTYLSATLDCQTGGSACAAGP